MKFIAINGGGTKTEAIIFDEKGCVSGFATGASSSAISNDIERMRGHLSALLDTLIPVGRETVDCVYAGISGAEENEARHNQVKEMLKSFFPGCEQVYVSSDAMNSFRACIQEGDGVVANVSTGSAVFCVRNNTVKQVGGWGYLFGDEGSTFDLGRRAIIAALREIDGRGSKTLIRSEIESKLGRPLKDELHAIYQGGRTKIASFAECLLKAAEKNDRVACNQLREAARDIGNAIMTAGDQIDTSLKIVALAGAMWKNKTYYNAVDAEVGRHVQLLDPRMPKVFGAAVQAMLCVGKKADNAFRDAFSNSLKAVQND